MEEIKKAFKSLYKQKERCESWEEYSEVYSEIVFELAQQFQMKCRKVRDICNEVDSNVERR